MQSVNVSLIDHATLKVDAESSIIRELSDLLTFEAPGAAFDPRVKKGQWDGLIRIMDRRAQTVPAGLSGRIRRFCEESGYDYREVLPKRAPISLDEVNEFLDTLDIPDKFERREYQVEALARAVSAGRMLLLSPTSSGKSMIIYTLIRWYGVKALVIVPTVGLVGQMITDFQDYGSPLKAHAIQDGREDIDADVVVSTWQSIYEMPPEWFDQFGLIIGDEAHLFSAQSLTGIMMKATRCPHRFGFTGTLNGSKIHQLQLEGLFGPTLKVTTTRELMDAGYVAKMNIQCVVLQHSADSKRELDQKIADARKKKPRMKYGALVYQEELAHIYGNERRNRFLVKMASRLPGNVLMLFHHVEHGDKLFDMMATATDRPVHLVNGGVSGLERNEIRRVIDDSDQNILLASVGTTSTGVSIKRINHLILASPWKSRIVSLQSIGRGLRLAEDKTEVTVYDVADDLTRGGKTNHTLKHLGERVRIYNEEMFDYRVTKVDLG